MREVMTPDVKYCFEDELITHVAVNMGDLRIRRLGLALLVSLDRLAPAERVAFALRDGNGSVLTRLDRIT